MSAENVAIVRAFYDALEAGDPPAALARLSPDMVWSEAENFPYADRSPYVGHDAIVEGIFARLGSEWDGFGVVVDELLDAGDRVVALGRYVGTYKASGNAMNPQAVHVWTLSDGKAVAFQQYVDTLAVARAMGASA